MVETGLMGVSPPAQTVYPNAGASTDAQFLNTVAGQQQQRGD